LMALVCHQRVIDVFNIHLTLTNYSIGHHQISNLLSLRNGFSNILIVQKEVTLSTHRMLT
jgi:hypothetical protein